MSATASRMATEADAAAEGSTETPPQMHVDRTEGTAAAEPSRSDAPAEDLMAESNSDQPKKARPVMTRGTCTTNPAHPAWNARATDTFRNS